MGRRLQLVGDFKVRLLEEIATHLREEEHNGTEHEQEDHNTDNVFNGVVRVEGDAIKRLAILVLELLDIDTVRVVGAHFVQRDDVQHNQAQQNDRQRDNVQREEAVQGDTGDQEVATYPLRQIRTDERNRTEQGDDHLSTPVGHLTPRQQVTHEGFTHQHQIDQHTEQPDQLTRLLIRAVHQATQHVQIHHHEERRCAGRVQVTQQPAILHITHDVLNGGKGTVGGGLVAHGQPDTGNQLINQHQHGQRAEKVEEVEVLGCVVLGQVIFHHLIDGHPLVHPLHQFIHQALS